MEQILNMVLSEQGFLGFLLFIIIVGLGYGFYKIGTILTRLLGETLSSFLEKFSDMVNSIAELSKNETETQKLNSEEHIKIMNILEKIDTHIQTLNQK